MLPLSLVHSRPVVASALVVAAFLCCVAPASAAKYSGKGKDKKGKGSSGSTNSGTLTISSGTSGTSSGIVISSGGSLTLQSGTSSGGTGVVSVGAGAGTLTGVSLTTTPSMLRAGASLNASNALATPALGTGIIVAGNAGTATGTQSILQTWGSGTIGQGLLASTFNTPPVLFDLTFTSSNTLTLSGLNLQTGVLLGTPTLATAQSLPVMIGRESSTLAASLPIGAVPEPGVAGLLVLGMSMVGLRRRRR